METLITIIVLIIYLLQPAASSQSAYKSPQIQRCSRAFLTVSSLWRQSYSNRLEAETVLEMNWDDTNCSYFEFDSIALFKEYPRNNGAVPVIKILRKDYPGYFKTNMTLNNRTLPGGWQLKEYEEELTFKDKEVFQSDTSSEQRKEDEEDPEGIMPRDSAYERNEPIMGDHCFPYWIATYQKDTIIYMDCLKIRPTWIWDHRAELGDMSLRSLFIPGTHNSGCYKKVSSGHKNTSYRRNSFSSRFLLTQDMDVYSQLVHGVRYLDIRVGYYPSTPELFWVNHDVARIIPLQTLIDGVKMFLQRSPDPIILDLHRFPVGFSERGRRRHRNRASPTHQSLVQLLWNELGDYAPADASLPLNTLWKSGKRLVISYADKASQMEFPWLRGELEITSDKENQKLNPPSVNVAQEWGNVQNCSQLFEFLSSTIENRKKLWGASRKKSGKMDLWAAMAELTPTPMDVVFSRPDASLRQMAHQVNRNVTRWFRDLWWKDANIIATDFFRGTNLIDVAVEANIRRSHI